jgi:hypothetical protein
MFETLTFSTISFALVIVTSSKYFDVATLTIGHYFTCLMLEVITKSEVE